jgi:uncharacterized protein YbjT (DUF2867 family)
MRVLVTGGAGGLASELTPRLQAAGHEVTVLSRRENLRLPVGVAALRANQASGEGLEDALKAAAAEVVINCATNARRPREDVEGGRRLAEAALAEGSLRHFIHVGIVGDDLMPGPFSYYVAKADTEKALRETACLPLTVQRATQFHTLIGGPLLWLKRWPWPFLFLPRDWKFQVIDTAEVAERLVQLAGAEPVNGRAPDMGGPEVRTLGELIEIAGLKRVLTLPTFGKTASGFKEGLNTCPDQAVGKITFAEWVVRQGK